MLHNRNTYLKYGCRCDVCRADNARYRRQRKLDLGGDRSIRLDATPLLEQIDKDGMGAHITWIMRQRWITKGISVYKADEICIKLGYHPTMVFGQDFYQECF